MSIEKLAGHFFKAIIDVQNKVSSLKQVHVIIFDVQNISKFLEAFKICCQSYAPPSKGFFKKMSNWLGYGKSIFFACIYPSLFHYTDRWIWIIGVWFLLGICAQLYKHPVITLLHAYNYLIEIYSIQSLLKKCVFKVLVYVCQRSQKCIGINVSKVIYDKTSRKSYIRPQYGLNVLQAEWVCSIRICLFSLCYFIHIEIRIIYLHITS